MVHLPQAAEPPSMGSTSAAVTPQSEVVPTKSAPMRANIGALTPVFD